jgi:hypothetical protein
MQNKSQRSTILSLILSAILVLLLLSGCGLLGGGEETPTPVMTDEVTPELSAAEYDPLIAINPTSGPPGSEVQITAAGFPPETEVVVGAGLENSEYDVLETLTTDAGGALQTTVALPMEAEPDQPWVFIVDVQGTGISAVSEVFNVVTMGGGEPTEPGLEISPISGPPGTTIEVTLFGFPATQEVQVGAGLEGTEFAVTKLVNTNTGGAADATLTIPEGADPGTTWLIVAHVAAEGGARASEPFQVIGEAPKEAIVNISPTQGPPGTEVQVTAFGFPPNTTVDIGAGREASEYSIIGTAETDGEGEVLATATLPDFAEVGEPWAIVVVTQDNEIRGVSDTFQVTGETGVDPTPTSAPTEPDADGNFTRTNIYLIALEDAGERGIEVGCGDSAIPVEVQIEPTIAPLRASLEALLAVDSELYGESGLYNALHQSDLEVGGIDIDQGHAVIELSGDLVVGGVCDEPRVVAQLRQTALQFSTVDRVTIYVNGVPLDEVFGRG